jgi:8-oxo-dGTP pyrophosphatase MutT (NUDIX family)
MNPSSQPFSDNAAYRFPVSVKGVIQLDDGIVLLRNERDEWELPGGKLEPGESPRTCLEREILEELSIPVAVSGLLDCWVYSIAPGVDVLIVTYLCVALEPDAPLRLSDEHRAVAVMDPGQLDGVVMPSGYKRSIERAVLAAS